MINKYWNWWCFSSEWMWIMVDWQLWWHSKVINRSLVQIIQYITNKNQPYLPYKYIVSSPFNVTVFIVLFVIKLLQYYVPFSIPSYILQPVCHRFWPHFIWTFNIQHIDAEVYTGLLPSLTEMCDLSHLFSTYIHGHLNMFPFTQIITDM